MTKHNYLIKISWSKFDIFRGKLAFWPLFDLQPPLNYYFFPIIFQIEEKIITWCFGASSAPFLLIKFKIKSFWFSNFYHFRHFLGSPGGLSTLLCTLQLKIGLKTLVNELSKMFNNSIKRHSFRRKWLQKRNTYRQKNWEVYKRKL